MVACPECHSVNVDWETNRTHETENTINYSCNDCGCEWTETMTIETTKHGSKYE